MEEGKTGVGEIVKVVIEALLTALFLVPFRLERDELYLVLARLLNGRFLTDVKIYYALIYWCSGDGLLKVHIRTGFGGNEIILRVPVGYENGGKLALILCILAKL